MSCWFLCLGFIAESFQNIPNLFRVSSPHTCTHTPYIWYIYIIQITSKVANVLITWMTIWTASEKMSNGPQTGGNSEVSSCFKPLFPYHCHQFAHLMNIMAVKAVVWSEPPLHVRGPERDAERIGWEFSVTLVGHVSIPCYIGRKKKIHQSQPSMHVKATAALILVFLCKESIFKSTGTDDSTAWLGHWLHRGKSDISIYR